jgi:hypothetical protein
LYNGLAGYSGKIKIARTVEIIIVDRYWHREESLFDKVGFALLAAC